MNIDWACPFIIRSPTLGDLPLNSPYQDGRIFQLNPRKCIARRSIRAETDEIPQGDGEIFHDRYATGSELQLCIQLWDGSEQCACDDVLVDMYDDLRGWLWSLLRPTDDGGRVLWTPSGKDQRMIDAARLLSLSDPEEEQTLGCTEITCVIDTPFPYAMTAAQDTTSGTGALSVPNDGNVDFWPVIKVNAPGSSFTITNNDLGLSINYSGISIGGGDYAEIDTFRGTVYLNGDGANLKPGINPTTSDFFPIEPGGSSITTSDSTDFLTNDAWA